MKIHTLNCGYINIHKDLLYSGGNMAGDMRKAVLCSHDPDLQQEQMTVTI